MVVKGVRAVITQEQRLAMKFASGKANQNYRKIDLKKKSYSKGKGAGKFMKKFEYKNKLAMKVCMGTV